MSGGGRQGISRIAGYAATAIVVAATLGLNVFTLAQIPRAATRVPWQDEWAMLREFLTYRQGSPLWPVLWSSYWGHRLVIPRLLFFADAQWGSLASRTWLTMLVQAADIGLLTLLAWLLVGRRSRLWFVWAVAAILNLGLSPLQMENFVWNMQTMFPLVYVFATAAFVSLARSCEGRACLFVPLSVVLALAASLTMPNGLLVWPVLVAQAIYLKMGRRVAIPVAFIGAGVMAVYAWHYSRPALGMGAGGMLKDPWHAALLIGLILAGPLAYVARGASEIIVMAAVAGIVWIATASLWRRSAVQSWRSAIVAVVLFFFLSAASIVAGRITPEWLNHDWPVASKYGTLTGLFWAAAAVLVLDWGLGRRKRNTAAMIVGGGLLACLMFAAPTTQLTVAADWADYFRGVDAVGAAFLVDAHDEQALSALWPVSAERGPALQFLRDRRSAFFAEPRASWAGQRLTELFATSAPGRCVGSVERVKTLEGGGARVEGWAWDTGANHVPDDLVIADSTGRVIGMARGGFYHRYIPGFIVEPYPIPSHARFRRSEWFGYMRPPAVGKWQVYGVLPQEKRVCLAAAGPV
jgi:hypothetical protein